MTLSAVTDDNGIETTHKVLCWVETEFVEPLSADKDDGVFTTLAGLHGQTPRAVS